MRAYEFINETHGIDEGIKDWVAGAAIGLGALGAGGQVMKHLSPPVPQFAQQSSSQDAQPANSLPQQKQSKSVNPIKAPTGAEAMLHKIAKGAGIKGTELAQFLAQTKHESADFSRMKEIGGKDYFIKKYDPKYAPKTAKILGNTKAGDGLKYYGRGYIQITGRDNYRMAGDALGLPLEKNPELASKPEVAAKIAVWYWKTRVAPKVQNFADTAAVTRTINPAMRGLEDRATNFQNYKKTI